MKAVGAASSKKQLACSIRMESNGTEGLLGDAEPCEQVPTELSVLVLGRTGSGKSNFIRAMMLDGDLSGTSDQELPAVSSSVASCTSVPAPYSIKPIDNVRYKIWDSTGILNTDVEDQACFKQLAEVCSDVEGWAGIVYVIDGRLTPSEAEACHFLLDKLFADVKPENLIVLRTKYEDWENYNVAREKSDLPGHVKGAIVDAEWIAVNFSRWTPLEESMKMVEIVKKKLSRWSLSLDLSDKTEIAQGYKPPEKLLNEVQHRLWLAEARKDALCVQKQEDDIGCSVLLQETFKCWGNLKNWFKNWS